MVEVEVALLPPPGAPLLVVEVVPFAVVEVVPAPPEEDDVVAPWAEVDEVDVVLTTGV